MPRGLINVCSLTGVRRSTMRACVEWSDFETDADGNYVPDTRQEYDVWNVRTIARVAGFDDWRYFVRSVMYSGFFRIDTVELCDGSGHVVTWFPQTCVATVQADARRYGEQMTRLQAERNRRGYANVSSSNL